MLGERRRRCVLLLTGHRVAPVPRRAGLTAALAPCRWLKRVSSSRVAVLARRGVDRCRRSLLVLRLEICGVTRRASVVVDQRRMERLSGNDQVGQQRHRPGTGHRRTRGIGCVRCSAVSVKPVDPVGMTARALAAGRRAVPVADLTARADLATELRRGVPVRLGKAVGAGCRVAARRVAGLTGDGRVARVDAGVHRRTRARGVTAALDAGLVPRAGDGVPGRRVALGAAAGVDIGQQRKRVAVSTLDRTEGLAGDGDRLGGRVRGVRCIDVGMRVGRCYGSSRSRRSWSRCPLPGGTSRTFGSRPRASGDS